MVTDSRALRLSRAVWWTFAGISIALGAVTALLLGADGKLSFTGAPELRLPVPPASAVPAAAAPGGPAAVLPELLEPGPYGPLPRIAPDGRRPFLAYARPFDADDARPKVALLVLGLGLQAELTAAAIDLPGEISLHFSAYAPDLPGLVTRARAAGHEVLLDLPMEPQDYPASDPGPYTLLAASATEDNLARLDWLLAQAPGHIALAGSGARFATSRGAPPVLEVLARRGLALVEIGDSLLASGAAAVALPYANAQAAIDEDPSILSIEHALAGLEAAALASGSALGAAQGYPVSLERLRLWATTLEHKGLVLAPVSALVIERSGLAAEIESDGPAVRQSRG
jgi:uncharacterized protein